MRIVQGKPKVYKLGRSWRVEIPQQWDDISDPFCRLHPLTWDFQTWANAVLFLREHWWKA